MEFSRVVANSFEILHLALTRMLKMVCCTGELGCYICLDSSLQQAILFHTCVTVICLLKALCGFINGWQCDETFLLHSIDRFANTWYQCLKTRFLVCLVALYSISLFLS